MRRRMCGVLCCVLVSLISVTKVCAAAQEPVTLRYKGEENVTYLVERTLKKVKKHKKGETQTLRERAVISYGQRAVEKEDKFLLTPKVFLLSVEGNMEKLKRYHTMKEHAVPAFEPWDVRYATGALPKKGNAHITNGKYRGWILAEMFEPFPILPKHPVQQGSQWGVNTLMALNRETYVFPVQIVHRLQSYEEVKGKNCARIDYTVSGRLETAKHQEMLESRVAKQTKPAFTLKGEGTAFFDPVAGIILKKDQTIEWTKRWTDTLDPSLARKYPHWEVDVDEVNSSHIKVELISAEEASRLIEASPLAKKMPEGRAKPEVAEAREVPVTKWRYYVKRAVVQRDRVAKREKTWVDYALVEYRAGKPKVTYVDEEKRPIEPARHFGPALQPLAGEKLSLTGQLPTFGGPGSGLGWPVRTVAYSFDILPMMPATELTPEMMWESTIDMAFDGLPQAKFAAAVKHVSKGYEERRARRCLKIEYTITGQFKSAEHPERFTAEELSEHRVEYSLSGEGVAYFDPEAGILVEKEQSVSFTSLYQRLRNLADEKVGWVPQSKKEESVKITLSLEPG